MTQTREPDDDRNTVRRVERELRDLRRRIDRLEETQITPQELARLSNQVDDDRDAIKNQIDRRFDLVEEQIKALDAKFDIVIRHINGEGNL